MSGTKLGPDWGWRCILQAREHDWSLHPVTRFREGGHSLEVRVGGDWRCEHALAAEAVDLLSLFLPLVARTGPLAIAQLGQSLDGRIATESGASHYINGLEARTHLHRLRAVVDAVLVGVDTVNDDDPQLTVRHVAGCNPVRVVLDPRGRVRRGSQLLHDGAALTVHVVSGAAGVDDLAPGVERVVLPVSAEGRFDPGAVLGWLQTQGLRSVLVEGGGRTVSAFMHAGGLDRLHLLVAPLLIGSGRPGLQLPPVSTLDEALRPRCHSYRCGEDTIFDLELRRIPG